MKYFQKYHSVAAFLIYIIVTQFKQTSFIDGTILVLLLTYVVIDLYSQFVKVPDIRKETMEHLANMQKTYDARIEFIVAEQRAAQKSQDKEISDIKTKVASVAAVKTVGMSNTRF